MSSSAAVPSQLSILHIQHFSQPLDLNLVSYCDARDLIAVVSDRDEVVVYRINGQIAFTIKRRIGDEASVTAVSWKHDGSCLAVGWNNGTFAIYSGENGKIINQNSTRSPHRDSGNATASISEWRLDLLPASTDTDDDDTAIILIERFGWSTLDSSRGHKTSGSGNVHMTRDDWFDLEPPNDPQKRSKVDGQSHDGVVLEDLTRAIMTLDVTKTLPRLSALPTHGLRAAPDGVKFSSQASTDGVFDTSTSDSRRSVNCLMACASDSHAQVLMDDTVLIGSCRLDGKPLRHAQEDETGSQSILAKDAGGDYQVHLIDLPFETLGGSLLHVVATNAKRVQNLLAYITHTVRCMQHDFTAGMQFPTRLLNNINAELEEKQEEGDIVMQLYHLAMTGEFTPVMLEWLVEVVKDTNHKRWDQAINSMYSHLRHHIFINLTPALDRLSVAASVLRGQARVHQTTATFDVSPDHFTNLLDAVDSLRLVGQKLQSLVTREYRQFQAFSKWLRVMVDIGIAGPGGKTATETEEREVVNFDYALLRTYISETMTASRVKSYVEARAEMAGGCSRKDFFAHENISQINYERVSMVVKSLDGVDGLVREDQNEQVWKGIANVTALLNLPTLAANLVGHGRLALEGITHWQNRMLRPPITLALPAAGGDEVLDVAMTSSQKGGSGRRGATVTVLTRPEDDLQTLLCHSVSATQTPFTEPVMLEDENQEYIWATCHAREGLFALVLDRSNETYAIYRICGTQSFGSTSDEQDTTEDGNLEAGVRQIPIHRFGGNDAPPFTPERIFIAGRAERRVCVVFGNQRRTWMLLDVSAAQQRGDDDLGEEIESQVMHETPKRSRVETRQSQTPYTGPTTDADQDMSEW